MAGRGEAPRMRARSPARPTEREVVVVAAVLAAGSEKAAAQRLGLSHSTVKHHMANARSKVGAETTAQLVWILASRLPDAGGMPSTDDQPQLAKGGCQLTGGVRLASGPSEGKYPAGPSARRNSPARSATVTLAAAAKQRTPSRMRTAALGTEAVPTRPWA